MAEERGRRDSSYKEWLDKNDGLEGYKRTEPDYAPKYCKTCKFAHKRFNGTEIRLNTKVHPYYSAGTCEKYETKPHNVFFEDAKCPKYEQE